MHATLFSSSTATSGRVELLRFAKTALLRLALHHMVPVEVSVEVSDVVASPAVAASLDAVALEVVSEAEVVMVVVMVAVSILGRPSHQTTSPILQLMVDRGAKQFTCAT